MYVLNTEFFGFIIKPETYSSVSDAANKFLYFKLKSLGKASTLFFYALKLFVSPSLLQLIILQFSRVSSYLHQRSLETTLD